MRVLVTGSSSGIGLALTRSLLADGHEVWGVARGEQEPHAGLIAIRADVRLIKTGCVHTDALVCCAGTLTADPIATNLMGTMNSVRAFPAPRVVCLAGGGADSPWPGHLEYSVSKAAVVRFVECYALEHPEVQINAVSPGAIHTPMTAGIVAPDNGVAMQRAIECIRWVLSEDSHGITGRLISAVWDDYRNLRSAIERNPEAGHLRRVRP